MLAAQPAHAAAERQAGNTGQRDHAERRGQTEGLSLPVHIAQGAAALGPHSLAPQVDAHAGHQREIDHQAAVAHGIAGHVVAAAAHGEKQVVIAGKVERIDHVSRAGAAGDRRRALVRAGVPDDAHLVVGPGCPE